MKALSNASKLDGIGGLEAWYKVLYSGIFLFYFGFAGLNLFHIAACQLQHPQIGRQHVLRAQVWYLL